MFENTLSSIDSSSITKNDRVEFDRVPALTVSEFLTQLPNLTDRVLQQEIAIITFDRVQLPH
ncbi:hypothetical protein [Chamaesiphon polymorphus]|uniref:Uncharacterized protein n=1 Tax=Chamaesiphon polymorphus CCALA 037 TaxID=2107692 RepID=A0A2T1G9T8_9CYAN|nr:hypothetical protein [Chamaesiphon polymorphus]PSB53960.1 hypothetical protein C7B77_19170 [Chamaesiphon polymorphus CCALA 037]